MMDQEIEVKFFLSNLDSLRDRLVGMHARLVQPRTHELNLRFDTQAGDLGRSFQVLRLRKDIDARLTYKGPGSIDHGVRVRQEIEFTVGDFDAAQRFLQALGYQVSMIYEKFRTVYDLSGVLVTLDEMPYGNFTELEGATPQDVIATSKKLTLQWEHRVLDSYTLLFEHLKTAQQFTFRDLTFDNFTGLEILPQMLSLQPADLG
ncbi:MAG: uncharacterized protein H6Q38_2556 [Chloroflexi bacterium]|nr:uncharacterized protein [Chloroflexota bacterium]